MPRRSVVWNFFNLENSKNFANCKICKKKYRYHGNTSNLKEHIKRVHPMQYQFGSNEREVLFPVETCLNTFTSNSVQSENTDLVPEIIIQYQCEDNERASISHIEPHLNASTSNDLQNENRVNSDLVSNKAIKRKRESRIKGSEKNTELTPDQISSIDEAVVGMVIKDLQPLSILSDDGFCDFVKKLNPRYTLPSPKTLSEKLLPNFYQSLRDKVLDALAKVNHISLTADYWKSNDNRSYLSLTGHYILKDKLHNTNLGTKEVTETHSGTNTDTIIEEICNSYYILSKVVTVVTDNDTDMKKAVSELNIHHLPCVAQTLNLTVNDALTKDSNVTNLMAKSRTLITHFKQSSAHSYKLLSKQIELNLPQLKLKHDIPTRWNSTYFMIQRLLAVKQPLLLTVSDVILENGPDNLSDNEWAALNDCLPILRPFLDLTEEMSTDKYPTISTVIPLIRGLLHSVKSIIPTTQIGRSLQKSLLEMTQHKLGHLESNKTVAKAMFLDPRFKKAGFAHEENAGNAQQWVIDELTEQLRSHVNTKCDQPEKINDAPVIATGSNETVSIWSLFDTQVSQEMTHKTPNTTALIMVRQYVETNPINRKSDPLLYWKNHATIFPGLYQLAKKYLSIPASSVPSEHIFSKAGYKLSIRRNCLSSEKLEEIMFLNCNLNFLA